MIWRTSNGRWFDRYGKWHRWFAWHPVTLENPHDGPARLTRAWWCGVARIGVIVRGRRFWLYCLPEHVGIGDEPLPQKQLRRQAQRGEHLRAVK